MSGDSLYAAALGPRKSEWTTVTQYAHGRARVDVVAGEQTGLPAGDFILADDADYIVAHPSTKTFSIATNPQAGQSAIQAVSSIHMSTDSVVASLDSATRGDTIDGQATSRYRLVVSYSTTVTFDQIPDVDLVLPPRTTRTRIVTDYWFADSGEARPSSMALGRPAPAATSEVGRRIRAATTGLPKTTILRMAGTTEISGQGKAAKLETRLEVTHREHGAVDLGLLTIPADFVLAVTPSDSSRQIDSARVQKWRARP